MKRVFIVHRWDGTPDADWYPWLKEELEERGFSVIIPALPDTHAPKIDAWVGALAKAVGTPDKETYFIGHSIGCQTILRYLASLPEKVVIGGAVFVAGWFTLNQLDTDEEKAIAAPWLETPIDFAAVQKHAKNFSAIFSDDDPFVPAENVKLFKTRIGADTFLENGKGHYNDVTAPSVLREFLTLGK